MWLYQGDKWQGKMGVGHFINSMFLIFFTFCCLSQIPFGPGNDLKIQESNTAFSSGSACASGSCCSRCRTQSCWCWSERCVAKRNQTSCPLPPPNAATTPPPPPLPPLLCRQTALSWRRPGRMTLPRAAVWKDLAAIVRMRFRWWRRSRRAW